MNQFQRTTKYIAITFAIILAIGIITAVTGLILNVISAIIGVPLLGNRNRIDVAYDFTGVVSLVVDNSAGSLEVKTGEGFRVEGKDVMEGFQAELTEDGTLVVSETNQQSFLWFHFDWLGSTNSKITVYLPEDFVAEKASFDTGLGNTVLEDIKAEELTISTGLGNFKGDRIAAEKVLLDGGLGSIELTDVRLEDAEIDCGIGSLRIEGELLGYQRIDGGIGNVRLELAGNREDYHLELDAGIGAVRVNGKKLSGTYTSEGAQNSLKVDGGLGGVTIDFHN